MKKTKTIKSNHFSLLFRRWAFVFCGGFGFRGGFQRIMNADKILERILQRACAAQRFKKQNGAHLDEFLS